MQHLPHLTYTEIMKRDGVVQAIVRVRDTCDMINVLIAECQSYMSADVLASLVAARSNLIDVSCDLRDVMSEQLKTVHVGRSGVVSVDHEISNTRQT